MRPKNAPVADLSSVEAYDEDHELSRYEQLDAKGRKAWDRALREYARINAERNASGDGT